MLVFKEATEIHGLLFVLQDHDSDAAATADESTDAAPAKYKPVPPRISVSKCTMVDRWCDGILASRTSCTTSRCNVPKPEVRHLLSLFLLWSQKLLHLQQLHLLPLLPGEGAPAPGGKADTTPAPAAEPETTAAAPETTPAAPAAEPETTAAAPETTPAAPAAEPAAPTVEGAGAALEDDSWLRWCNLCGERSYWRENACLNPHCTVTRQIFVKYVIIIRRCKISCNPSFLMVSL